MKTELMEEFLVLGKCLNFTKAAEKLYISQSVLSRHMAVLEKELNTKLLKRSTHLAELTPAGQAAMESFAIIINEKKKLDGIIKQIEENASGTIRFGVTDFLLEDYFESHLSGFMKRCPAADIDIESGKIEKVIDDFRRNETDVAMVVTSKPEFTNANYYFMGKIPFYVAVAEENPLSKKKLIDWNDLNGELLIYPTAMDYSEFVTPALKSHGIIPKDIFKIKNDDLLFHMIRTKKALSFVPGPMVEIPHRKIKYIPFADKDWCISIGFVFRAGSSAPLILEFLESLLSEETDG